MNFVKLTEVCDFQGGTQPPKSEWSSEQKSGYIRMLQIRDFTQRHKDYSEYVKDKPTLKKCCSEDILIGRYGASIGKICTGLNGAYNVALIKSIPNTHFLDNDYLKYIFIGENFQNFIQNIGSRAAQAGFNKTDLSEFQIPLPPLEQQKKIAAILDAADTYRQLTKALIAKYDELTQSLFLDMFGDPVTNPKSFPTKSLGELCLFFSGRAWKNIELGDKGYRIVRISNLHKPDFPYWLYDGVMIDRHKVEDGDLLFSWAGVATSIDAYLYKGETALLNQHIYNIKPKEGLNKKYLFKLLQLNLENLRSSLGGGVGQFHLKKNDITSIQVLMPDPDLMKVYLSCIETLDNQKAQAQASLEKAEELFASLLQKSFKGEII